MRITLLQIVLLLIVSGCGPQLQTQKEAVVQRARFDLSCQDLNVQELGDRTFGVEGCEKRATYVTKGQCGNGGVTECTAIMNTDQKGGEN